VSGARAAQVWRALCRPLTCDVAVKVIELERQDVDLVRRGVSLIRLCLRGEQRRWGAARGRLGPGGLQWAMAGREVDGRRRQKRCSMLPP